MGKFKPTEDQQVVLNSQDKNLLVSASAGSGKTATIIEKIFNLVKDGLDLKKILVITFTEAASSEMKSRLKDKFFEFGGDDLRIREQAESLNSSYICTLHSLCSKLIRKYFYVLDLNPNFAVLNEENANFLKVKALVETFNFYSKDEDKDFFDLSAVFGGRNFLNFKKNILSYYEFLCSIVEKENFVKKDFLDSARANEEIANFEKCYDLDLNKNVACKVLNEYVLDNFYYYKKIFEKSLDDAKKVGADYFVEFLKEVIVKLDEFKYEKSFLENRKMFGEIVFPVISRKKLDQVNAEFKEEFKGLYKEFVDKNKQIRSAIFEGEDVETLIENLKNARNFVEKFNEVEGIFEKNYSSIKKRKNVLDFNDLEKYVLKLMEDESVKKELNQEFEYAFVDEYQDINEVQETILQKIGARAKMVMVGDVKQSIYGFRNSTPEIFVNKGIRFDENSAEGKAVLLNDNFRSRAEILNFVNAIFSKIMDVDFGGVDYKKKSMLNGRGEFEDYKDFPYVKMCLIDKNVDDEEEDDSKGQAYSGVYSVLEDKNLYESQLSKERKEAIVIAKNIVELIKNGKIYDNKEKKFRPVKFGDIAILGRKNDFLRNVCRVLEEYKIPVSTNQVENIFLNPDVYVLLSLLRIVSSFHDDISLCTVLSSVFGKFDCEELSIIKKEFCDEKYFYESFKRYLEEGKDEKIRKKAKDFFDLICDLRKKVYANFSIYNLFNYLDNKFNFLVEFSKLPGGLVRRQTVFNYIESFNNAQYNYDLENYLEYVRNFEESNNFVSALNGSDNSVKVGTIHSSKGLEYPIVFVCGLDKSFSNKTFVSPVLKDSVLGLGMGSYDVKNFVKKENLAKSAFYVHLKKKEKAEELRLLYVALTRAKNNLILVGHFNSKTIRRVEDCKDAQNENSYISWVLSGLSNIGFGQIKNGQKDFVDKQKGFEVCVEIEKDEDFEIKLKPNTDFKFLFDKVDNLDEYEKGLKFCPEDNKNIALKNTVSSMLQEYAKEERSSFNVEPKNLTIFEDEIDRTKLGTIYHKIMQEVDFFDVKSSQIEYLKAIIDKLDLSEKYYNEVDIESIKKCVENIKALNAVSVLKEQPFLSYVRYCDVFKSSRYVDKILIQGVADLIVKTQNGYVLVDYKTNRVKNSDQLVGKYRLQLKIYKDCLEKAMNIKIDKALLYSFCLNKFVEVN